MKTRSLVLITLGVCASCSDQVERNTSSAGSPEQLDSAFPSTSDFEAVAHSVRVEDPDSLLNGSPSVRSRVAADMVSLFLAFDTVPAAIGQPAAIFMTMHTQELAQVLVAGDPAITDAWAKVMAQELQRQHGTAANVEAIAFARTVAGKWLSYSPSERAALKVFNTRLVAWTNDLREQDGNSASDGH